MDTSFNNIIHIFKCLLKNANLELFYTMSNQCEREYEQSMYLCYCCRYWYPELKYGELARWFGALKAQSSPVHKHYHGLFFYKCLNTCMCFNCQMGLGFSSENQPTLKPTGCICIHKRAIFTIFYDQPCHASWQLMGLLKLIFLLMKYGSIY